jgi:hypothetical protein
MLLQAYEKTPIKNDWAEIGRLKEILLSQSDKEFNKYSDGKKVSTWLKHFPHKFEVKGGRVHMK